jgi:hypothetical protein
LALLEFSGYHYFGRPPRYSNIEGEPCAERSRTERSREEKNPRGAARTLSFLAMQNGTKERGTSVRAF